jgi:small-conductance mechanosensitive channel
MNIKQIKFKVKILPSLFNNISRKTASIFLLALFFLYSSCLLAQNIISDQLIGAETEAVPSIDNLQIKWWQYFDEAIDVKDFNERAQVFSKQLGMSIKDIEPNTELMSSLSNINKLLDQYSKQKFSSPEPSTEKEMPVLEVYSLPNLLEMNKGLREIRQLIQQNKQEIESANQNNDATRYLIEQQKINYYSNLENPKDKLKTGFEWILSRIKLALDSLKEKRLGDKSEFLTKSLQEKSNLLKLASTKLIIDETKNNFIDLDKTKSSLSKVEDKINSLSLKLTESIDDNQESRLKKDILKLDLTLALIEQSEYKLLLNQDDQNQSLVQFYDKSKIEIESTRELINSTNSYLREIDSSINDWQKISLDTLLWPISAIDKDPSKKVLKLDEEKREKAQQIIKEYENLKIVKEDNVFILNLLTNKLQEVETGFSKTIHVFKDFMVSAKNNVINFIYKPIITINEYPVTLLPLIKLLLIILFGYLISKTVTFFITRFEKKHKIDRSNNRSSLYLMHRLIHYFIIFISIMSGFSVLGINLGNITLIAGALSVGIGFGLQNLVSNFVSGLTIMFEKTLSVGDYIEIDGTTTGVVKEIRARSTRINTNDNIDIIIPNSDMVTNKVVNWTLKESIRRIKIPFGVAYGTDKELVKTAALEAASNVQYTLNNLQGKEPDVWLVGFGDNSVDFLLLVWVAHYGLRRPNRIKNYYLWELDTALKKYNIEIPFPQRDVHLNIVNKPTQLAIDSVISDLENPYKIPE